MSSAHDVRDTAPDKVDLREALWPVENVGQMSASAASAAAAALEYHCNRMGEPPTNLSSLFIHYNARVASGSENANVGTTMQAAFEAITKYGACREESWPLDAAQLTSRPSTQVYDEARKFAGVGYMNPMDAVEALGMHYPVPIVAQVSMRCLEEAGRTGVMPLPTPEERQPQNNHAMLLVGYDKTARTFIARNCWGAEWGAGGHCTIPFDVLSVIAPSGTQRLWIVTAPQASASQAAAPPPAAAPAPSQPQSVADLAARMRQEIRGGLERDISDASKRIRDMLARPSAPQPVTTADTCSACSGRGACWGCGGRGCGSCGGSGTCPKCGGRGTA